MNHNATSNVPASIFASPRPVSLLSAPLPQCDVVKDNKLGCLCVGDDGNEFCRDKSMNGADLFFDPTFRKRQVLCQLAPRHVTIIVLSM